MLDLIPFKKTKQINLRNFKASIRVKNILPQGASRYFIAIIPPSPILEEVQEIKNYFKDKYESRAALNSPPHITLHMPFFWKIDEEDLLISLLTEFAKSCELMTSSAV